MAGNEELDSWWEGLTKQERAEAKKSRDSGQLDDSLRDSLTRAGVTGSGGQGDRRVIDYLKMRH